MITSHILHFGVGNFHRSHQAKYLHQLHSEGRDLEWAIVGAGLLPGDVRMRDALRDQDYAYTLVECAADGTNAVHRITSIIGYLYGPDDPTALIEMLAAASTRIVSLTITEGGYNLSDATGRFDTTNTAMRADTWNEDRPTTVFGYLAAALRRRRRAGIAPFTVLSCDNIQNNGDMAREALVSFIGMTDVDLADWVEGNTAFPGSMVDRITPVTTDADRAWVRATTGYDDSWPVVSEDFTQWVMEDHFPSGRPRWEDVGAQLVDDVAPFETMKLRMLNGAHQALAYVGLLRGHTFVHEAMTDPAVASFVDAFLQEAESTVPPLPGIDLLAYRMTLLKRFSNASIRDTLERLATDASDRIPKFVVPIARDLIQHSQPAPEAAAVIASWVAVASTRHNNSRPLADRQVEDVWQGLLDERVVAGSFLDRTDWFGALGENPTFRTTYVSSLERLRRGNAFESVASNAL
ncbi:mannitol dehydrogenase family protein [uncultured Microbacterium sp.]|uniref:mannitol dehydrogenase family protein n=1 Tax=uncultured Microbacterium sp. TaxID=191216 RepID=UPI00262692CF|nr:mannitol dehydrogenase family protein [uncultured Microbacterium sp.]